MADRHRAGRQRPGEVVQSLRSLWYYHQDVYVFHCHFLTCSDTPTPRPSGWLLVNKPVSVAADLNILPGEQGCDAPEGSDCLRQVLLIGTPADLVGWRRGALSAVAMWLGAPGLALRGRGRRGGVDLAALAPYDDRPIFYFYAIATLPFLVLGLTLAMGKLIGAARAPTATPHLRRRVAGSFMVLALLNFAWFWPVLTYDLLSHGEWLDRIWFSRWI